MKYLKETNNILTNPDGVREKALTLDYYTNENHPTLNDGGEEWVCTPVRRRLTAGGQGGCACRRETERRCNQVC